MAWYRQGTAAVTSGSAAVVGTTTGWTNQVLPEDRISFDGGGTWYEVLSVTDNTHLTLATNYAGSTASGLSYAIDRSGRGWDEPSELAQRVADLLALISPTPTTTRGDLIVRGATYDQRLALGTSGYALMSNGTDPAWTGFRLSDTGAVTRTWQAKAADIMGPGDFGIVGDGSTDNATALAAALAAIRTRGRGLLRLPAGNYLFSSTVSLTPDAPIAIEGEGIGVTRLLPSGNTNNGLTFDNTANSTLSAPISIAKLSIEAVSGALHGLRILGAGAWNGTDKRCNYVTLHHLRLNGFATAGIRVEKTTNLLGAIIHASNCGDGMACYQLSDSAITMLKTGSNSVHGIRVDGQAVHGAWNEGVYLNQLVLNGDGVGVRFVGGYYYALTDSQVGSTVSGSVIVDAVDNFWIEDNEVSNTLGNADGITLLNAPNRGFINDNFINGCTNFGLVARGTNHQIKGNTFNGNSSNSGRDLQLIDTTDTLVDGNRMLSTPSTNYSAEESGTSDGNWFRGNHVKQSTGINRTGANSVLDRNRIIGVGPIADYNAVSGTSGGVPYYSSANQLSSSAALAADQIVTGGGAGAAPKSSGASITTTNGRSLNLGSVSNDFGPSLLMTNTAASANGPLWQFTKNRSGGPAQAGDVAFWLQLLGGDSGSVAREAADLKAIISAVNSGNVSGYWSFLASNAGSIVEAIRAGGTTAHFPSIGTTASAANAFLDNAASPANSLLRSTSSIDYKASVEDLDADRALQLLKMRPVWYRSKAPADNPNWSWYGLIAEEVAAIDPRLVNWGFRDSDYETVTHESMREVERVVMGDDGVIRAEVVEVPMTSTERVLKPDAVLKPDGVQYERLTVGLLHLVQSLWERVERLEAASKS